MAGNSQTAYALSIDLKLIPEDRLAQVGDKHVAKVAAEKYRLSTGFIGTPWLLPALTVTGHTDITYRLLLNEDYPSLGYEMASGATTMWECWDSLKPDGTFGDVGMNSLNHCAHGAVGVTKVTEANGVVEIGVGSGRHHYESSPRNVGLAVQLSAAKSAFRGRPSRAQCF